MNEWRELPKGYIVAFAEAVKAGDEVEINDECGWVKWEGRVWMDDWSVHARSKPKTKQVQLRGFLTPDGYSVSYAEGSRCYEDAIKCKWPRVPSEDRVVEVEE